MASQQPCWLLSVAHGTRKQRWFHCYPVTLTAISTIFSDCIHTSSYCPLWWGCLADAGQRKLWSHMRIYFIRVSWLQSVESINSAWQDTKKFHLCAGLKLCRYFFKFTWMHAHETQFPFWPTYLKKIDFTSASMSTPSLDLKGTSKNGAVKSSFDQQFDGATDLALSSH